MDIKGEYYFCKNKNLAITLSYITKENFYVFDDKYVKGEKIYSFRNTEKLSEAFDLIETLRNK